jgi:hypothetical protein
MDRGIEAPLSPHEEVTLRRIALDVSKAKPLRDSDAAHFVRLRLVDDDDGRLSMTALGRQLYQGLPRPAKLPHEGESDAVLRANLQRARDR